MLRVNEWRRPPFQPGSLSWHNCNYTRWLGRCNEKSHAFRFGDLRLIFPGVIGYHFFIGGHTEDCGGCCSVWAIIDFLTGYTASVIYVFIFLGLFVGGLGVPVPEDLLLLLGGFLSWAGYTDLYLTIVISIVGAVVGDCVVFYLVAGTIRMNTQKFVLTDLAGAILSVPLVTLLGYFLSEKIDTLRRTILGFRIIAGLAVVVVCLGFLVYRWWAKGALGADEDKLGVAEPSKADRHVPAARGGA